MQHNRSHPLAAAALAAAALAAQGAETAGPLDRRDLSGGTAVTVEDAPFLTFLRITLGRGAYGVCLGTLIARNWIATAAHCIDDAEFRYITVTHISGGRQLGGIARDARKASRGQLAIHRHPDWNAPPGTLLTWKQIGTDIALLELPTPFRASKVQPARLPTAAEASTLQPGLNLRIIGKTEQYRQAADAEMPIHRYTEPAVIAMEMNRAKTQPGDSGGPVLLRIGQEWVLAGIHSAQTRTGLALAASTDHNRDWIEATIGGITPPSGPPPVTQPPVTPPPTPPSKLTLTLESENLEEHICTLQTDSGVRSTINGNSKTTFNWTISNRFSMQLRLDCRPL